MLLSEHHLISEWDWEANNQLGIDGNTIKTGSNKRNVWWIGECGHRWSNMSPAQRCYQNHGCPYCSGHRVLPGFNDLRTVNRTLAEEYSDKNIIPSNEVSPNSHDFAIWVCSVCDYEWKAEIKSRNQGRGCPICSRQKQVDTLVKRKVEKEGSLQDKFPEISLEWDFGLNYRTPSDYTAYSNQSVYWICKTCNNRYPMRIVQRTKLGQGCPACGKLKSQINRRKKIQNISDSLYDKFPEIAIEWDFTKNQTTPDNISAYSNKPAHWICSKCGYSWESVIASRTLQKNGCKKCGSSKGEKKIEQYLDSKGIRYIREHKFDDCKNQRKLPFDFYIPSLNIAIEYDGKQHFEPITYFGGYCGLESRKVNDTIKTSYCEDNNITLIRIPFTEHNNIEVILSQHIR